MADTIDDIRVAKAAVEVLDLFDEDQPTAFIALELTVSSRVQDAVRPGTKLAKAIRQTQTNISKNGFSWLEEGGALAIIVDRLRALLQRASEKERTVIVASLLSGDPDFISDVAVSEERKQR